MRQDISYLNPSFAKAVLDDMGEAEHAVLSSFYLSRDLSSWIIHRMIRDPDITVSPVVLLSLLELVGLLHFLLSGLQVVCKVCFQKCLDDDHGKWHSISVFFWDTLPALSQYSAMKLLHNVVPTVVFTEIAERKDDIAEAVKYAAEGRSGSVRDIVWE